MCSAHVTIRSSPLPLLLSALALESILPPFNSTCNQLYALQRAVQIERAAPGHPARPQQLHIRCKGLRRPNVPLRGYQHLSAYTPPEYIRAPPVQPSSAEPYRSTVQHHSELSQFPLV